MPKAQAPLTLVLLCVLSLVAAASMWFYVDPILVRYQVADAAAHNRPRGNLSDLYPRWLGARELLQHGRNPYSDQLTVEIQKGYYGRPLDPSLPDDPKDRQGFAYPAYVIFLLAPTIKLPFEVVQAWFRWILLALSVLGVWFWLKVLHWRLSLPARLLCIVLLMGSFPEVQGIKLQQLSLLVAALLAASTASVASGYLFLGGAVLALATIKPQLALPLVAWLLMWTFSEWKSRWRFAAGFAAMMALLLVASELILPGWWRMFLRAIHEYHRYTGNESVLDQLVNWGLGPHGGAALALVAVLASGCFLWKLRGDPPASDGFGKSAALVMALTVLIVPMYAPYNQVLLLPAILLLAKEKGQLLSGSGAIRTVYFIGIFALSWAWLASIGLTVVWWFSHPAAMSARKLPLYATFSLPVLVFTLTLVSVRRQRALRVPEATR